MKHQKRKHIWIVMFILFLAPLCLQAQNNGSDFTLSSEGVTFEGNTIDVISTMERSSNTLVWNQSNGGATSVTNFNIVSTSGNLDPETMEGTLELGLMYENNPAQLTLISNSGVVTLILILQMGTIEEIYTFSNINFSFN